MPSHPTNPHLLINKWKASCLLDKSIFMFSAFQMACIGSHCADFGELESLEVLRWSFPWYYNKCFNKMLDFEFMDFSWISYVVKSFHLKCIQPLFRDTNEKAAVPFKELKEQQIDFIFGTNSFSLAPLIERKPIKSISAF